MTKVNWSEDATKIFKGKVVSHINGEYTSDYSGDKTSPVIVFTDGSWILVSGDKSGFFFIDEGNQGNSFWTS
jgi:hypothetical protein